MDKDILCFHQHVSSLYLIVFIGKLPLSLGLNLHVG